MEDNRTVYEQNDTVEVYSSESSLQAPEKTLLELLKPQLSNSSMLDIGIGGGRTSLHFAPVVLHYTGIDYSENMVKNCVRSHANLKNANFRCVDARDMSEFKDDSFDLILFSFNGIDYVSKIDREQVLKEVHRVGKHGAYYVFSSHNTMNLSKLYSFQVPRNPINYPAELRRFLKMRSLNGPMEGYSRRDWFTIKDGGNNFQLETFYIHPSLQVKQLGELGYHNVECFDLNRGGQIRADDLPNTTDPWIYYKCQIIKENSQ